VNAALVARGGHAAGTSAAAAGRGHAGRGNGLADSGRGRHGGTGTILNTLRQEIGSLLPVLAPAGTRYLQL
jgi:hypothetical protein